MNQENSRAPITRKVFTLTRQGPPRCEPEAWPERFARDQVRLRYGHLGEVSPLTLLPDRRIRLGAAEDEAAPTWERETGRAVLRNHELPWVILTDEQLVVLRGKRDEFVVRARDTGGLRGRLRWGPAGLGDVTFSPRGHRVLVFHGDPRAEQGPASWSLIEVPTGELIETADLPAPAARLAWSPDGRRFAAGTADGWVRVFDGADGSPLGAFGVESAWAPAALALSPDGALAATASRTAEVALWRVADGEKLADLGERLPWKGKGQLAFVAPDQLLRHDPWGTDVVHLDVGAAPPAGASARRYRTRPEADPSPGPGAGPRAAPGIEPAGCPWPPGTWWATPGRRRGPEAAPQDEEGRALWAWRTRDGAPMARLPEAAAGPEAAGYVDVFPVTVRLYQAFVEASGRHPPDGWDQQLEAPENPVVFVDVADAEAYAQWAGGRLPTELEWQAAARGDDPARPFPWDQGALDPANFSGSADKGLSSVDAHPGGVSPLGVMDLAGNAAEWTATPYPQDLLTDPERVGPRLPPAQHGRVVKGGDHLAGWLDLRVSRRQAVPEDERRGALGFRLVVDL